MSVDQDAIKLHKKHQGKIEIVSKVPLKNKKDLSLAYTPGVAAVSKEIAKDKNLVNEYTNRNNTVAIVSDGSAVLGLGDIGPEGALPVMEGKAILFKEFAGIDGLPLCIAETESEKIIAFCKAIAPTVGAINLEDISAPRCFEIESRLREELNIPVMHDDQHGTAVVTIAALHNALKVVGKTLDEVRVVINGAGAAGIAIAKLLKCSDIDASMCTPVKEVLVVDSQGIIYDGRSDLNKYKQEIALITNPHKRKGRLVEALLGADVFIGVSKAGLLSRDMVKLMGDKAIVFAMANPDPEISPADAKKGGATIYASGRSDYDNQVNNVLAYPGIFKGALMTRAKSINHAMMIAASHAIANFVTKPNDKNIVPSVLDAGVANAVANAVAQAAIDTKVATVQVKLTKPAEAKVSTKDEITKAAVKKEAKNAAAKPLAKKAPSKKTVKKTVTKTPAKKESKKAAAKPSAKKVPTKKTVKKAPVKKEAKKDSFKKAPAKKKVVKKVPTKKTEKRASVKKKTSKKPEPKVEKKGGLLNKIKLKR